MAEPQLVVSPQDIEKILKGAKAIGNPMAIVQRFAGLGEAEQQAGIPSWAWLSLAVGVGVVVGMQLRPAVDDFLQNRGFRR